MPSDRCLGSVPFLVVTSCKPKLSSVLVDWDLVYWDLFVNCSGKR